MHGRRVRPRRHATVLALAAAALVAACRHSSTAPRAKASEGDRAYIDAMVPQLQAGVMLADEATARASHPELRTFAQQVRTEESAQADLMRQWKLSWFDTDSVPPPTPPADIAAGAGFDLAWIRALVAHHDAAIDLSKLALRANARAETDSMALHIITQDSTEQRQLRTWAQQWYGVTVDAAPSQR